MDVFNNLITLLPIVVTAGVIFSIIHAVLTSSGGFNERVKFESCRFFARCPDFKDEKDSVCKDEDECEECPRYEMYLQELLREEEERERQDRENELSQNAIRCPYCGLLIRPEEFREGRCPNCSAPRK